MKIRSNVLLDTVDQVVTDGIKRGLGHLSVEDQHISGNTVHVHGREVLNLGTASYLNLERHPDLVEGAREMLERYGTQFAASRTYVQLGIYDELEANLERIFGSPVLVTASTTLGHMSAIPVLVSDQDAIILDQQVHNSMQTIVQIVRARGVPVHVIRHNRLDMLEDKLEELRKTHRHVWYFADGVYSMFGDTAPAKQLHELMNRYAQLRCYVDDAHGFGWTGEHGVGWYRSQVPHHPQLIQTVSLNKSYASAGGAIIFPNAEMKQRVRNCGPTMIFCGPIQPPMLGVALAATRLHLSDAIKPLHKEFRERIVYCSQGLEARGIPQFCANDTPLYFIPTGMPKLVQEIAKRLMRDGFYVNLGIFPAVPTSMGGVRFHMHRAFEFEQIDAFLDALAHHYKAVLSEAGTTPQKLARAFRAPHLKDAQLEPTPRAIPQSLTCHIAHHINDVPARLWNPLFEGSGPLDLDTLGALGGAFNAAEDRGRAESACVWITDRRGDVVLAAPYCVTSLKEDMFSDAAISKRVEALREAKGGDFLVSKVVTLGLPITLGNHLFLDQKHTRWRDAVRMFLDHLNQVKESENASRILLREFEQGANPELEALLVEEGYIEVAMPSMMQISHMDWDDREGYIASLKSRYRREVRKEILPFLDKVSMTPGPLTCEEDRDRAYALYLSVHRRGFSFNVEQLPREAFDVMLHHDAFDVLRFSTGTEMDAVMVSHVNGQHYTALLVGFEPTHVHTHNLYKVILFHTVERARALGCTSINLAFTADVTKQKVGARPVNTSAYALIDDTFQANVLENL